MLLYKLKVSTKTLEKLDEISDLKNLSHKEVLENSISEYYTNNQPILYPKENYLTVVSKLAEQQPPYHIEEQQPSLTGLSEGAVLLKNCNVPLPTSWFKKRQPWIATTKHFLFSWVILQVVFHVITLLIIL